MTSDKQPRPGVPVPPRSLVQEWTYRRTTSVYEDMADAAAWGADEQLRLCLEWMKSVRMPHTAKLAMEAMRPKPPSLKQQALAIHARCSFDTIEDKNIVREALEALPDDEGTP